jgi:hypothetical protein
LVGAAVLFCEPVDGHVLLFPYSFKNLDT